MATSKEKILSLWQHRKTKPYLLRALAVFVLVGALGFFAVPPLVKSLLVEKLAASLHRPVTIRSVSINPYALSVTIDGLAVAEREGGEAFLSFDSLYLNLESSSLVRGGLVVNEFRLVNPKISLVRHADRRYNFSDLVDEFMARPKSSGPPPLFSVANIQLAGGTIAFDDRPTGSKHVVDDISLGLPFISNMGRATQAFVEPAFAARIDGAPLSVKGRSKPFAESHESELGINLDAVQLGKYHEYIPMQLPIKIASGTLDGDLKVVFHQEAGKPPLLGVSGQATLTGLRVNDSSGEPLASVKRLDLVLGASDLLASRFVIDHIVVDSPEIRARIGKDGGVNWQGLLAQVAGEGAPPPAPATAVPVEWTVGEAKVVAGALRWVDESRSKPVQGSVEDFTLQLKDLDSKGAKDAAFDVSWRVDAQEWMKVESFAIKGGRANLARSELSIDELAVRGTRMLIRRAADGTIESLKPPTLRLTQAAGKVEGPAWKVVVAKYRGTDLGVRFEDNAVSPPATQVVSNFNAEVDNISTDPGQTTKLTTRFQFNDKGRCAFSGSVKLAPLEADIKVDVKGIEILPLQPYFAPKLNIAVTRGELALAGDLEIRPGTGGSSLAPPGLAGRFKGAATIGDFAAVEKFNSADFLRWKSLHIGQLDLRLGDDALAIGEIALSDFFARAIINPEGKLNLLQMVRHESPEAPVPADAAPDQAATTEPAAGKAAAPVAPAKPLPFPLRIERVTLQAGSINFTDNFIKPNYSARLRQIGGRVSGLSTAEGSIADVELRGSYDDVAPLNLTARVNPLSQQPYLDLQADVKGLDMSPFSPYSGKYAGYAIEKGKLSLFVKYKIENRLLTAENRIFLDQLTFGEPVDSPEATKLPVNLALALLKNRRGEIDINLPISGSLDDPQFSVGGLILKVIGNLFVKAVSAPFALLGSMFGGGGGDMSSVEFDYGRAALGAETEKSLENLAKALVDRPALKLEIEGRVDSERDREGLKQVSIERKVRAQKRAQLAKSGVAPGAGEAAEVSAAEYPALLERVYDAEKFPKPRNIIGLAKSLPVAEMEKLILTNTTIDDNDLHALADRRARAVRDWLLAHAVEAERVFLLPAKVEANEGKSENEAKSKGSRVDFSLK
jgi:hypothetical protein